MLKKDWNYRRGDLYLVNLGEHRGNIQGAFDRSSIFRTTVVISLARP